MVYAMHGLPLVSDGWLGQLRGVGAFGVPIFFVLSAYLITTLMLREREATGGFDLAAFYGRRILRIWPLYFLALLVGGFILTPYLTGGTPETYWLMRFAGFVGNGYISTAQRPQPHTGVLWSVCVEEQFYVVWPLVCLLGRRNGMVIIAGFAIAFSMLYRQYMSWIAPENYDIWFKSATHLESLGWGAILALLGSPWKPAGWQVLAGLALVTAGALLAGPVHASPSSLGMVGYTVASIGAAVFLKGACHGNSWLCHPMLVWVGKISFGVYVYHLMVLMLLNHGRPQSWATFFGGIPITLTLAYVSNQYYERWFIQLKKSLQRVPSGAEPHSSTM